MKFILLFALSLFQIDFAFASCKPKSLLPLGDEIQTATAFYDLLENRQLVPDYFGRNKDALFEVLVDNVHVPFTLICKNNAPFSGDIQDLIEVVREAQQNGSCVQVICRDAN